MRRLGRSRRRGRLCARARRPQIYNQALPERELLVESAHALGLPGSAFVRLGCANCTLEALEESCTELDGYHPCQCHELMGGGLTSARAMGWLRGPSDEWQFHAQVQNAATCVIVPKGKPPEMQTGFCCQN